MSGRFVVARTKAEAFEARRYAAAQRALELLGSKIYAHQEFGRRIVLGEDAARDVKVLLDVFVLLRSKAFGERLKVRP